MPPKSREFAPYVPALILRHFQRDPAPPTQAVGERFPAVALFADIAGSTKITNDLSRLGRLHGPEEMYRILNAYYQPLVTQLNARGGDVIGFAGDAVLAVWAVTEGSDLGPAVRQATQAALEIQRDLNNMELAPGIRLSLRICLGSGELSTALVGGKQGFWQMVASGQPLDQIRAAGSIVRIGEVFVSQEACAYLGDGTTMEQLPSGGAFVRQLANPPSPPDPSELPDVTSLPEEYLRPFVQRAVQQSIDVGVADYLAQCRTVSVLFVRLGRPPGVPASWQRVQDAMNLVQEATARYEGTVAQFIEDDKGLIALLAFGLPLVGHEDDARRAIEAAAFLQDPANNRGNPCGIGASTGLPFCGALGSPGRRVVYTVTGADVVRGARLMQLARNGETLCDEETYAAARKATALRFAPLPRFHLKGYETPARLFRVLTSAAVHRFAAMGREREREQLHTALDEAVAGRGRVLWLEGEVGVGAEAIVDELIERAAGRLRRLGVPDRASDRPRSPWSAVWADVVGLRGVRDLVLRQTRIEKFFATRPGPAPLLNDLLGTSIAETPETLALSDRAAARNERLFSLIEEFSRERPVLMILEGADQLDAASQALALRLAGLNGRVTILASAQPVAGPHALRDNPAALVITLQPLDSETIGRLVCERLRADRLGDRFATLLRERARGNPSRAERECERLLAEDRLITDRGVCELTDEPTGPVTRVSATAVAPLIGRAAERAVISAALDALVGGASRGLLIEGDTGSGKSRLIEEAQRLAQDRAMAVVVGHCAAVEAATPYYPWRAICERLLGLPERADAAERGSLVLAELTAESQPFAPLLNDLLGLAIPEDEVIRQMAGQNRADNLSAVLLALIAAATDGRPTLILIEDAQWADSASWRLAKLVRDRLDWVAVALAVGRATTALPAEYEPFATADATDRITLNALSEVDTRAFACARFRAERVNDNLAQLIWRRTQGNPLFIEQMTGHLMDAGLVAIESGTVELRSDTGDAVEPMIPDTMRGLVTARIDRLPPAQQLTAKVSSVIGTLFPSSALTAIHPDRDAVAAIPEHISLLTHERLLRQERSEPIALYDFPHPILQQVCYELLTRPQRQRLHHNSAEWFQSPSAGIVPEFRLIAHHWGRAGVIDRQIDFLALAGDRALRDGAFREAVTGFTELLRLSGERFAKTVPPDEAARRAHWEYQLGEAHFGLGELPAATEHFQTSLALRNRVLRVSSIGLIADTLGQVFKQFARRLLFRRRPTAQIEDSETREVAATYLRLARIYYYTNDMLSGTNAVLRALNIAETVGPSPALALAYASTTILTGMLNWHRAAREYARLAEPAARATDNLQTRCLSFAYLCMYHLGQGNWQQVQLLAQEALTLTERLGDHQQGSEIATIMAMMSCFRSEYPVAMQWAARIVEEAKQSGNTMHMAWAANIEGECFFRTGRHAEAVEKMKESAAALHGKKDRTEEIRIDGMFAGIAARVGDWPTATTHALAAEAIARQTSATTCSTLEGFAGIAEVRVALAEREPQNYQARKSAKAALTGLRKHAKLYPIGRPRLAFYEGRMQHLAEAPTKAVRTWRDGLATAIRLEMWYDAALLHERLGKHSPSDSAERHDHIREATILYERIGVEHR